MDQTLRLKYDKIQYEVNAIMDKKLFELDKLVDNCKNRYVPLFENTVIENIKSLIIKIDNWYDKHGIPCFVHMKSDYRDVDKIEMKNVYNDEKIQRLQKECDERMKEIKQLSATKIISIKDIEKTEYKIAKTLTKAGKDQLIIKSENLIKQMELVESFKNNKRIKEIADAGQIEIVSLKEKILFLENKLEEFKLNKIRSDKEQHNDFGEKMKINNEIIWNHMVRVKTRLLRRRIDDHLMIDDLLNEFDYQQSLYMPSIELENRFYVLSEDENKQNDTKSDSDAISYGDEISEGEMEDNDD
jgi:hypothetical protein